MNFMMWEVTAKNLDVKLRAAEARIAKLEDTLQIARPLLQEIVNVHCDPESPEYNECDTAICGWCEEARKVLNHE